MARLNKNIEVPGFQLQSDPKIYVTAISGRWLLERTTPSWRIDNPEIGFQRMVRESRARTIALSVLDQQRTFPNAIILATDKPSLDTQDSRIIIPFYIKFLVVDGQHRLYAQKYSECEATYACLIHTGLSEIEMARLFLEINDNQKRVPSSLRWDLVRLVRPADDEEAIETAELIYSLATEEESPLFQRIDLTGEQSEIQLKQGSIAPELRSILKKGPFYGLSYEQKYQIILQFFIAARERDKNSWGSADSSFYKARILRVLLRLLPEMIRKSKKSPMDLTFRNYLPFLKRIDESSLNTEMIRAAQGSAGMKAIYKQLYDQMF